MTEHKYLKINLSHEGKKTKGYTVVSKSDNATLGYLSWHGPWRQYCFYTVDGIIFNHDCLNYIKDYLIELNKIHRENNNENKPHQK